MRLHKIFEKETSKRPHKYKNFNFYFLPQSRLPIEALWCKNKKNPFDENFHTWAPCYSQSPLLMDYSPPSKSGLKLVCNVNIVYGNGNLKSENSEFYAQKPQRNCTIMNSASGYFFAIQMLLSSK